MRISKILIYAFFLSAFLSACGKKKTEEPSVTPTAVIPSVICTNTPTPFLRNEPVYTEVSATAYSVDPLLGSASPVWNDSKDTSLTKVLKGDKNGKAYFRVLYTEHYLYIRVLSVDNTPFVTDSVTEGDHITVYLNENGTKPRKYGVGDCYLSVGRNGSLLPGTGCETAEIKVSASETPGGYLVIVQVPLLTVSGTSGTKAGFDIAVTDYNENGMVSALQWKDGGGKTGSTLAGVGTVYFTDSEQAQEINEKYPDAVTAMPLSVITVDGEKDKLYNGSPTVQLRNTAFGNPGGSGAFTALYDSCYLYLYIRIDDATPDTDSTLMTRKDSVEIFLSADGEKPKEYRSGTDMHYQIGRDGSVSYGSGASPDNLSYRVVSDDKGYRIELSLDLGQDSLPGKGLIGLDIRMNDSFGSAMRDFIAAWSDTSLLTHTDLSAIGTLVLQ